MTLEDYLKIIAIFSFEGKDWNLTLGQTLFCKTKLLHPFLYIVGKANTYSFFLKFFANTDSEKYICSI
jgi:hypothetical protein